MNRVPTNRRTAYLAVLLSAAGIAGAAPTWRQLLAQTTPSPQAGTTQTPKPGEKKDTSGWHHFGESQTPPPAEPRPSDGWHHFGEAPSAPPRLPAPPPRQSAYASRLHEMELQMFALLNRDRMNPANEPEIKGRPYPLQWNDRLAEAARAHSHDMLYQRFFDHVDPQGRTPAMRVQAMGMDWQAVGENIAIHTTIPGAEAAFMDEPRFRQNHRANILSSKYTEVGIGIVQGPDGRYYITQDFYAAPSVPSNR